MLVSLAVTPLPLWITPTGRPGLPHLLPLPSAHPNTSLGHQDSSSFLGAGLASGAPRPSTVPAQNLTLLTPSFLGTEA